jgi:hypothetical protein
MMDDLVFSTSLQFYCNFENCFFSKVNLFYNSQKQILAKKLFVSTLGSCVGD